MKKEQKFTVNVRWFDGYLEFFEATEVRIGSDMLYLVLSDGQNRHIPLRQVRAYDVNPPTKFQYKEYGTITVNMKVSDMKFEDHGEFEDTAKRNEEMKAKFEGYKKDAKGTAKRNK